MKRVCRGMLLLLTIVLAGRTGDFVYGEQHSSELNYDGVAASAVEHRFGERVYWNDMSREQYAAVRQTHSRAVHRREGDRNLHAWFDRHPVRREYYRRWAQDVRHAFRVRPYDWDQSAWWQHRFPTAGHWWNYQASGNRISATAWWAATSWHTLGDWFPEYAFADPVLYDYGTDGNVYQDDRANATYIAGQNVGTAVDYAKSAAALATVALPASDADNHGVDWLPLGNFAFSTREQDTRPTRVVQLAVNRQGIVSGMHYNRTTDKSLPILGQVDRELQRVAFRLGSNRQTIFETGLYNLTQEEVPVLIHFGPDQTGNALLVRMNPPRQNDGQLADGALRGE